MNNSNSRSNQLLRRQVVGVIPRRPDKMKEDMHTKVRKKKSSIPEPRSTNTKEWALHTVCIAFLSE
jgi:hypothetical protein